MTSTDLARLQFAFTSINHFFFVPVTIGLAFLTALLQTAWYRNGRTEYLRLTRFFGTLLVINIAIGVVTGLVQEFEFGMNWGAYSRLVGNIFGAPLAMEGLGAFFLESTFLGLWLFGWDKLPRRVHLATIWAVSLGSASYGPASSSSRVSTSGSACCTTSSGRTKPSAGPPSTRSGRCGTATRSG
jgi:cytochrome d ubiquinol oxidase subunit I